MVENQHRKISGYRDLTEEEIALVNDIKAAGARLETLVETVTAARFPGPPETKHVTEGKIDKIRIVHYTGGPTRADQRWVAIARTHFQEGLMALVRSVTKPEGF